MRRAVGLIAIAACGGGTTPTQSTTASRDLDLAPGVARASARQAKPRRAPLDPISGLGDPAGDRISWVTPAQARLEIAATPIEVATPLEAVGIPTTILDEQGSLVRVAVRLPHARFSLWTDRKWLFSIVQRDTRVRTDGVRASAGDEVRLRAGARVHVIEHGEAIAKVRFIGGLELVGWISTDLLADEGAQSRRYQVPVRGKMLHVSRGGVIRSEAKWAGAQLAVTNRAYVLDGVASLPGNWYEVNYADEDVIVHGFYQQPSPPGRTSPTKLDAADAPLPVTPNAQLAGATCLYARARGEPVGYLVGDQPVFMEPTRDSGWWTVGIDTPWGPVLFVVTGPDATTLEKCMPVASSP